MPDGVPRARSRWMGALALAVVVVVCGGLAGLFVVRSGGPPTTGPQAEGIDAGIEAWCADDLAPVAGGGCYAAPAHLSPPVPLLVYLHGRYSPKTLPEELERQRRVARRGTAKGFAVLAMRGVQGECTQAELADHWCWPSNPGNAEHGSAFVARLKPAMAAARERLGAGPNLLLGFSNGGYFATLIATRDLAPFDAVVIAHAGPVPPTRAAPRMPPVLLITADDDPSDGEMQQLHAELTRERWAHEFVGREGGHALLDWDVDMALTFFARTRKEHLPLTPPLQPPRPRPRASEDASEDVDPADDEADEDGGT